MTTTTRAVRDQGFQPLECSIPPELTIDEYRSQRRAQDSAPREPRRPGRRRLSAMIRR